MHWLLQSTLLQPHPMPPAAATLPTSPSSLTPLPPGEHNPVEDARAAMDLALLKFERGPGYAAGGGDRGDRLAEVLDGAGRCAGRGCLYCSCFCCSLGSSVQASCAPACMLGGHWG